LEGEILESNLKTGQEIPGPDSKKIILKLCMLSIILTMTKKATDTCSGIKQKIDNNGVCVYESVHACLYTYA